MKAFEVIARSGFKIVEHEFTREKPQADGVLFRALTNERVTIVKYIKHDLTEEQYMKKLKEMAKVTSMRAIGAH